MKKQIKYNILIGLALLCFCQTLFLACNTEDVFYYKVIYNDNYRGSYFFVILTFILPPLYEELVFRGVLLGNRKYNILYKMVFLIVGTTLIWNSHIHLPIVYILIFTSAAFYSFLEKDKHQNYWPLLILSVIVFTLGHYNFETHSYLNFVRTIGSRLGMALVLSWVCLNFGIYYSIIIHFLYNSFLIMYFMTNNSTEVIKSKPNVNNGIEYTIKEDDFFENTSTIYRDKKTFKISQGSINLILAQLSLPNTDILIKSQYHKYSIEIINFNNNLTDKEILSVLNEQKIIDISEK